MNCRAAFISGRPTGTDSFGCGELELLCRKPCILVSRKDPAPLVGEVKERQVKHEHGVVNSSTAPKNPARRLLGVGIELLGLHFWYFVRSQP
jgi:hypothetical protein